MTTPLERIFDLRRKAVFRLFETKFSAAVRITVGSATCENAAGAVEVYRTFRELLDTHPHVEAVLGRVGCSGRCDLEPVVTVFRRGEIPVKYVHVTPEAAREIFISHVMEGEPVAELAMPRASGEPGLVRRVVALCGGARCAARGAEEVREALLNALDAEGLAEDVLVTRSACQGLCEHGPVAFVYPENVQYVGLTPDKVARIVTEHLRDGRPVADYVWQGERLANRFFPIFGDVHFYGSQLRLTLRNCGVIDPESLDEYLAVRGYEALARVLAEMSPDEVIDAVTRAGLRGRGGGGFPTGLKWKFARREQDPEKYMICNADEGDPGAFMDRSTIEGDPHTILEGLMIGAYAVGATKGFVYIRAEYPLAVQRIRTAIAAAREAGLLGDDILGSGWSFDVEVRLGAGAFVCGEETALIQSIEGKRGMPRPRPPYPTTSGLWGRPTVINNVETLANVPVIILDGPEWFASIGTEKSKGTKVFALAGKVNNTGLIEVPMGTTLREVVYGVGGGIRDGKEIKAVQTGGPAGGCIPASMLDTPVDYDSLTAAGSIMGSGGMIVMDEDTCMVDVARYFLEFTQSESCGKCTPCREGTLRMLEILNRITQGKGREGDVEKLERLAQTVKMASLCGLGQAAPNPVLSTIRYFRDEYDAHIREKRCPAGVCAALIRYEIDPEKCVGCGACLRNCPVECITGAPRQVHVIDAEHCIRCGRCYEVCRFNAVKRS